MAAKKRRGNRSWRRPNKDTIVISFERFQILRKLAHLIDQKTRDEANIADQLRRLKEVETKELAGTLG